MKQLFYLLVFTITVTKYSFAQTNTFPSSGNVGIGTTTPTANLQTTGSITASSATARGVYFNNTLNAAANNDVLVGLDIAPLFSNGTFTGVSNLALRATGTSYFNGKVAIGTTDPGNSTLAIKYTGGNFENAGVLNIDASESTISSPPAFSVRLPSTGFRKGFQITNGPDKFAWVSFEYGAGGTDKPGFALGQGGGNTRDVAIYRSGLKMLGLSTGGTEQLTIGSGVVGIGTTSPTGCLSLAGNRSLSSWTVGGVNFQTAAATYTDISSAAASTVTTRTVNSFGVPTLTSTNAITVTNAANIYIAGAPVAGANTTITNAHALHVATGNSYFGGNVGIGTTNPQAKLAVSGDIFAQKVKVTQIGWADYVFEPSYQLPTLQEVEVFIKQHKHLPGVPSAKEVEKEGLDVGENQATLLKKIEELTLYVINMQKQVDEQQKTIKEQNRIVQEQQQLLSQLRQSIGNKKD